jgi:hypothetical protein
VHGPADNIGPWNEQRQEALEIPLEELIFHSGRLMEMNVMMFLC